MTEKNYDLAVIGSGPGGYVAAIRAAQLGMKTAIVEREHLGGICLNWGCIPTKALLRSSEIYHLMHRLDEFGFSADNISFDPAKIVKRSRDVASRLSNGVKFLMKKHKIDVIEGHGKLIAPGKIAVEGAEVGAKNIILATGARARSLPGLEPDGKLIWTYKEAMVPEAMPKSLLVIGSGAIGIEFASFYNTLGVDTTVVEILDRVLPVEDEEISQMAEKAFKKQGMKIHTKTEVKSLKKSANSVTAELQTADGKTESLTVDRVILAVGIVGNVEDIGLEELGIDVGPRSRKNRSVVQNERRRHLRHRRSRGCAVVGSQRPCMKAFCAWNISPASRAPNRFIRRMCRAAPIAFRKSPVSA